MREHPDRRSVRIPDPRPSPDSGVGFSATFMQDLRDALSALARHPLVRRRRAVAGARYRRQCRDLLDPRQPAAQDRCRSETLRASSRSPANVPASMRPWATPYGGAVRDRGVLGDPFVWATDHLTATHRGESLALDAVWASGPFFDVLGVPAVLGRTFATADDQASGGPDGPVAVISYGLWQRVFGGAATTLGETLEIDRVRFTIVGVTPLRFLRPRRRPLGRRDVPARNGTASPPPASANRHVAVAAHHRSTTAG